MIVYVERFADKLFLNAANKDIFKKTTLFSILYLVFIQLKEDHYKHFKT